MTIDNWTLTIDEPMYESLARHLFPGDEEEHGAVIAAGIVTTDRGTRLLARELFTARDGVDFVHGTRGYRLTAEFVGDRIRYCRDQRLTYLAVHNHGPGTSVGFSSIDLSSHERGYPALLEIAQRPVGALVFADRAIAGDIWTPGGSRHLIQETMVIGQNVARIYPAPPPVSRAASIMYDRQARWFGDRGQALLSELKVGVIGVGGVGQPVVQMLARLGVGTLLVIDPDRVDETNLNRLDATRRDARVRLRKLPLFGRFASKTAVTKVKVAARIVKRANARLRFVSITKNVIEPEAASQLVDCDFIFLAADTHQARMVFNAVLHQYLIPGVQLATRIDVDPDSGAVDDIQLNERLVLPQFGCLRCAGLISPVRLQEEAMNPDERQRNRYVDEVPAPSVITFNTFVASQGVSDFLLMMTGLIDSAAPAAFVRTRPTARKVEPVFQSSANLSCPDCDSTAAARRARGDYADLPIPERSRSRSRQ